MTEMLTLALADALLRPLLLLVILTACVLVAIAIARDVLSTPYPELRDHDCACGPGAHHPGCPTRLTVQH